MKYIALLFLSFLLVSCDSQKQQTPVKPKETNTQTAAAPISKAVAKNVPVKKPVVVQAKKTIHRYIERQETVVIIQQPAPVIVPVVPDAPIVHGHPQPVPHVQMHRRQIIVPGPGPQVHGHPIPVPGPQVHGHPTPGPQAHVPRHVAPAPGPQMYGSNAPMHREGPYESAPSEHGHPAQTSNQYAHPSEQQDPAANSNVHGH